MKNEVYNLMKELYENKHVPHYSKELMVAVHENSPFYKYMKDPIVGNIAGGYYTFMAEICKKIKPKHVVELGNREGAGALAILEGLKDVKDSKLTSIDIIKDLHLVPAEIRSSDKVQFLLGDVLDPEIVKTVKNNGKIDVILFDTTHTAKQLEAEWNLYEPLFNDVALILVDDIYYESKHLFFDKIKHDKIIDKRLHSTGFGIVFFDRKKRF